MDPRLTAASFSAICLFACGSRHTRATATSTSTSTSTSTATATATATSTATATAPSTANLARAEVIAQLRGSGAQAYWLFEPAKPSPETAPLIVFNHGWRAVDPRGYKAWIDHIVQRGNIVVYPVYQDSLGTPILDFTPNAIAGLRDAIHTLQTEPGHVRPQLDHFAIVGHSMGGVISANMAALWKTDALPTPRAVMCVEPGKTWGPKTQDTGVLADLSQIPADALLLTVVGDQDRIVRDVDAKRIFNESTNVPLANKNYITLVSDDHGEPPLKATHMAPVAWGPMPEADQPKTDKPAGIRRALLRKQLKDRRPDDEGMPDFSNPDTNRSVDALDIFGTWKLFDGLTDAAFYSKNRAQALGNTPEQRFMGLWSDGVPVKELLVTDHP
jgi:acetyl esterase/lipase